MKYNMYTDLFFNILSIVFFVYIRFWNIIFHPKSMVSYLNRQTLKQQNILNTIQPLTTNKD